MATGRRRRLLAAAGALAVGVAAAVGIGCRGLPLQEVQGERVAETLVHGSRERTFLVYDPPSRDRAIGAPLVIVLHGGRGTGERMVWLTRAGFDALADRDGFVVAYPDGIDSHWNDGRDAPYRAHQEGVDDVGFLVALIDHLAAGRGVDPGRVYVAGISNGSMMAQRLACERPDRVAAIGAVGAPLPEALAGTPPARPVPAIIVHGTEDPLAPWGGGDIRFWWRRLGRVISVPDTARFWAAADGAVEDPVETWVEDRAPDDGTRVRRLAWGAEGAPGEVVLYAVEGGGHTWPGGQPYLPEFLVGRVSGDFDACEEIWAFFRRHRTP